MNLTPWNVIVYSGHCHWDKEIDELCMAFERKSDALSYIKDIETYRPEYWAILKYCK